MLLSVDIPYTPAKKLQASLDALITGASIHHRVEDDDPARHDIASSS